MGWDVSSKKVIRINGRNTGPTVWDLDAKAGQPIDSQGHDLHDEDLAQAISQCLNVNGINVLQADLDMSNQYRIVNMPQGIANSDIATIGQLLDNMTFNDGNRTLTISSPEGKTLSAVIPDQTGGAGGTVTSINIGSGLEGPNNPIVNTGTIQLAKVHDGLTGKDGIAEITVDTYGRVTKVVGNQGVGYVSDIPSNDGKLYLRRFNAWEEYVPPTGGGSPQVVDLTVDRTASVNTITANGTPAQINIVTSQWAGLMSPSQRAKLEGLSADPVNLSILKSASSNSIVASGGGTTARIDAVSSSNAGLMTPTQKAKLDNNIPDDGTTLGNFMAWSGSSLGWQENGIIRWNGGAGIDINGYLDPKHTYEGVQALEVRANIVTEGILITDSLPNIEFDDTVSSDTNFCFTNDADYLIVKGASTATAATKFFTFTKSSASSNEIEAMNAEGGAVFTQGGVPLVTQTEFAALIDTLIASNAVTPEAGNTLKALLTPAPQVTPYTG